jgi:uncharacterized protein (TIGR03435 family)
LSAQAPSPTTHAPTFDVASIKSSAPNTAPTILIEPGGRFIATYTRVSTLVALGFGDGRSLRVDEIVGLPPWTSATYLDITAKTADPSELPVHQALTSVQLRPLLRALLRDRFGLHAHTETQQLPVYNLVRTTSGVDLPQGMRRSVIDCSVPNARCTANLVYGGAPRLTATGATMDQVAAALPGALGRPVRNVTNLAGRFDFVLRWSRFQDTSDQRYAVAQVPAEYDVPLLTAIRDQLNLKLDAATGPVDVLVIDHIERPTED